MDSDKTIGSISSVGNIIIDEQHQHFVSLINSLSSSEREGLPSLVKELTKYINYHFDSEESLLKAVSYPFLDEHIAQHEKFVAMVASMIGHLETGELTGSDVRDTLLKWYVGHICTEDMKYKEYIRLF